MIIRLCIAGAAAISLILFGLELSSRIRGELVLYQDAAENAADLARDGRWAEARMVAGFALSRPELGDEDKARDVLLRSNEELESFKGQLERFAFGAVTGEPTDMPSMLGSLSLDLFVLGDIRDLAVQGWKEAVDGSGDSVILTLSAIGLTTTLAPHLDWAPALLKMLKRSGALTQKFTQFLSRTAKQSFDSGDYSQLTQVVGEFGQAASRLGPGPLRGVMASVNDAGDLTRVANGSGVDPRSTYVVTRLFGKDGVKAIGMNGKNVGQVAASIKAGSRVGKFASKSIGVLPTPWLGAVAVASLLILIAAVLPSILRRFRSERGEGVSVVGSPIHKVDS